MVDASKYKSRALRALVTEVGTDTRRQLRDLYESSAAQQDDLVPAGHAQLCWAFAQVSRGSQ